MLCRKIINPENVEETMMLFLKIDVNNRLDITRYAAIKAPRYHRKMTSK